MTSLQYRENAYESEFAHQEELKFRAREKAVKALAAWAAERLGKAGDAAESFAAEVVAADVTHRKLEETLGQVAEALAPAGIGRAEVDRMLDRLLAQAEAAVRAVK